MKLLSWDAYCAGGGATVSRAATVGVFDGLHLGHRALLDRVLAFGRGAVPTVFTFRENPKAILRPSAFEGDIFSLDQKLDMFDRMGVSLVVLIDFSGDFGKITGKEFVDLITDRGSLRYLAVGSNFRCGHRLDTDAERIRALTEADGVVTEIVAPVLRHGLPVSSSRIRTAIAAGSLVEAAALLGRNFVVDLGTAPLTPGAAGIEYDVGSTRRITPPDGRYPVIARTDDASAGIECAVEIENGRVRVPARIGVVRYVEFIPEVARSV